MRANRIVEGRKLTERPSSDAVVQSKLAPKLFTFLPRSKMINKDLSGTQILRRFVTNHN